MSNLKTSILEKKNSHWQKKIENLEKACIFGPRCPESENSRFFQILKWLRPVIIGIIIFGFRFSHFMPINLVTSSISTSIGTLT
jgi:Na+-transporting NADH:ubiquinone oxidoreductase subunit NqrB